MRSRIIDDPTIHLDISVKEAKLLKHRGLKKVELERKIKYLEKMKISYKVREFHISEDGISNFIKDAAKYFKLKGVYACRSLNKIYAYRKYIRTIEKSYNIL